METVRHIVWVLGGATISAFLGILLFGSLVAGGGYLYASRLSGNPNSEDAWKMGGYAVVGLGMMVGGLMGGVLGAWLTHTHPEYAAPGAWWLVGLGLLPFFLSLYGLLYVGCRDRVKGARLGHDQESWPRFLTTTFLWILLAAIPLICGIGIRCSL